MPSERAQQLWSAYLQDRLTKEAGPGMEMLKAVGGEGLEMAKPYLQKGLGAAKAVGQGVGKVVKAPFDAAGAVGSDVAESLYKFKHPTPKFHSYPGFDEAASAEARRYQSALTDWRFEREWQRGLGDSRARKALGVGAGGAAAYSMLPGGASEAAGASPVPPTPFGPPETAGAPGAAPEPQLGPSSPNSEGATAPTAEPGLLEQLKAKYRSTMEQAPDALEALKSHYLNAVSGLPQGVQTALPYAGVGLGALGAAALLRRRKRKRDMEKEAGLADMAGRLAGGLGAKLAPQLGKAGPVAGVVKDLAQQGAVAAGKGVVAGVRGGLNLGGATGRTIAEFLHSYRLGGRPASVRNIAKHLTPEQVNDPALMAFFRNEVVRPGTRSWLAMRKGMKTTGDRLGRVGAGVAMAYGAPKAVGAAARAVIPGGSSKE